MTLIMAYNGALFQIRPSFENTYVFFKDKVVLLGITMDNKLTFEAHIDNKRTKSFSPMVSAI